MTSSVMETRSTNAACFLRCRTNTSRILCASPKLEPNLSASSGLHHPYRTQEEEGGKEKQEDVGGQGKVPECSTSESFGTEDRLQRISNEHSLNTVCGLALHRHYLIQRSNDITGKILLSLHYR